ncbi:hypothetical protein F4781DRAFT_415449 [Annulohypoxylon bovei var. microspora]|nr:hypothetical protein F4781DRAFT_415449 [Annulohypoxylon bovei var. microspora]
MYVLYICIVHMYAESSSCEPPKDLTTQIPPWGPSGAASLPCALYADARWPSTEKLAVLTLMQRRMFCCLALPWQLGYNGIIATANSAPLVVDLTYVGRIRLLIGGSDVCLVTRITSANTRTSEPPGDFRVLSDPGCRDLMTKRLELPFASIRSMPVRCCIGCLTIPSARKECSTRANIQYGRLTISRHESKGLLMHRYCSNIIYL